MPRASSEPDGFRAGQRALLRPISQLDVRRLWVFNRVGEDGCGGVFIYIKLLPLVQRAGK